MEFAKNRFSYSDRPIFVLSAPCNADLCVMQAQFTVHLAKAVANASDAAHSHAWEQSSFGLAAPETQVDLEYNKDLICAWSLVASERGIETLDALRFADHLIQ